MTLEGVGVTPPARRGLFQLRLSKQAHCVIELRPGKELAGVAKKPRELAAQIERLKA